MSGIQYDLLTLGDLRRVVQLVEGSPDDVPVLVFRVPDGPEPSVELTYTASPAQTRFIGIDVPTDYCRNLEDSQA